jgi:hypothetical protein
MKVVHDSDGPWHEGFAQTFSCLGEYVTVVCGSSEAADAIAEYFDPRPRLPPEPAIVGRRLRDTQPQRIRREVVGS